MKNLKFKDLRVLTREGFTLIEVIIAVSIIAILASLSVPRVAAYIDKAKNAKVISTGKQIYTAAMWSYTEQSNKFDKDDVEIAVKALSGVKVSDFTSATVNSLTPNKVDIVFKNDEVNYTLSIDADTNIYSIKKAGAISELFNSTGKIVTASGT